MLQNNEEAVARRRIPLPIVDFNLDKIMLAFPNLLSTAEVNTASKWEKQTLALINGVNSPINPRQAELLDVVLGRKVGVTRFEIIWEKLVTAYFLLNQISDLTYKLNEASSRVEDFGNAFQQKHKQLVEYRKASEISLDGYKEEVARTKEEVARAQEVGHAANERSVNLKKGLEEAWTALCNAGVSFEPSVLTSDWERLRNQWQSHKVRALTSKAAGLTDEDVAFIKSTKFAGLDAKAIDALYVRTLHSDLSDKSKKILEQEYLSIKCFLGPQKNWTAQRY